MGTNVYAVRLDPRAVVDWKKLEVAVENKDPWSLVELSEGISEKLSNNRVHIGKRSAGWKFLFDYNGWKYYDHTEESIREFLGSCYLIEDEYGDPLTVDEFWKDFALFNPTGLTGETYEVKYGTHVSREIAFKHNWYESENSPAGDISKSLPYRFSNDTGFC